MLANSRQIVKEVKNTTQLDEALSLAVQRSKSSMDANACSIYISDMLTGQYLLMATDGLISAAVGKARVNRNEGLVGWVAAHEETINLANAADHPGFCHTPEIGDEDFHGLWARPLFIMAVYWASWWLRSMNGDALKMTKWDFSRQLNGSSRGRMFLRGIRTAG